MGFKRFLAALMAVFILIFSPLCAQCADEPEQTPAPTMDLTQTFSEKPASRRGDRGERTVRIQQRLRDLGYLNYRPTGYFMSMTNSAVIAFQNAHSIMADGAGVVGGQTMEYLFSNLARRKNVAPESGATPESRLYPANGELIPWEDMDALLPLGSAFRVIDLNTSIEYRMTRTGGRRHMDVSPVDKAAYQAYLRSFSGRESSNKRPVLVEYDGGFYAASIYGTTHTADEKRVTCLYFSGSRSDSLGLRDVEHDANVLLSAGVAQ